MTPERYAQLNLLLTQVWDRPENEREPFARELCQGDETLLAELLKLLHESDETTDALDYAIARATRFSDVSTFTTGEVLLDRFRIVRFLGQGGMGEVYEAADSETGRIALKTVRPEIAGDPLALARFRLEVQCARQATGTNVCRIHEIFSLPAGSTRPVTAFLTMEFLEGITLHDRISTGPPIPLEEAEKIAVQICCGLQIIHDADIIHRDLKTRNVMLAERKRGTEAVLMDFGLARQATASVAAAASTSYSLDTGKVVGTPQYMAPEQFEAGPVSAATDIYALGVLLYELATGKLPFEGSTPLAAAVGRAKPLAQPSALRPGLPGRWDTTIERCLRYQPAERFQSASAVAEAILPQSLPTGYRFGTYLFIAALALLAALSLYIYRTNFLPTHSEPRRIAVLPFEDLSHDPRDQVFCDGLSDVFVSQLAELERFQAGLSVVPSSEVRHQHISSAKDAYQVFGVNYVLTGSVQRSTDSVHVLINMIDAKNVRQIRSKSFSLPDSEPLAMQTGVVSQAAELLDLQLAPQSRQLLTKGATNVPGAYDDYLQGYGYLREFGNLASIDKAIDEFKQASKLDPTYALAYAGLGEAYWYKYLETKDQALLEQARAYCDQAIDLHAGVAAAFNTRGLLNAGIGKYDAAIADYRRSLNLEPNNRDAFTFLASAYERLGKLAQAEATFKQAIAVRPDYWNGYVRLATFYHRQGRYQESITVLRRAEELVPENPVVRSDLGGVYQLIGSDQLAEVEFEKSIDIRPTVGGCSNLGSFYFYRGRFADAARLYSQAATLAPKSYEAWGNLGDAYRLLGNQAKALQAYKSAIEFAQESLNLNKTDAIAMSLLSSYFAKSGNKKYAVELARQAEKLGKNSPDVLYAAALAYELSGQRKPALAALKQALALGFSRTIVVQEPDLQALRSDPHFGQIAQAGKA